MASKLRASLPLLLTIVLAAFFRFYALDRIPPGIYLDEVINGRTGLEAVRTRSFEVFYHVGSGREGLWINMVGIAETVFGANQFGLRVCAALVGTVTVICFWLLARELFSGRIAILGSWLLACSFWPVWISRMSFRAVLMPFFLCASLYFLFRAWREEPHSLSPTKQWLLVAASGILYGAGFHSYVAFRFTPFLIALLFVAEYWRRKKSGRITTRWLAMAALWLFAAFVVILPLAVHFLQHPQDFWLRASQVSILSDPHPLQAFGASLLATAGMFNIRGDPGALYNIPDSPHLLFPVGVAFLFGLVQAARKAWQKSSEARSERLLCAWFGILLIPQLLTLDVPNSVRVIGVIPPVFVFAGIGADALFGQLQHRKVYKHAFLLGLMLLAAVEFYRYFFVWGRSPEVARAFGHSYVEVGQYLNSLPARTPRYVIAGDWGMETVKFLTHESPSVENLTPEQVRTASLPCGSVIVPLYNVPMVFADLTSRGLEIHSIDKGDFRVGVVECGK